MSLPKIRDFTDFNHYPSDPQPTTDADMQDYMQNQNDILTALTKRLWQPQTAYKLGDIVASDAMADGLVAVCTIAGVTSDIEPEWGVNEATVIDNSCTWIMRPAYCYGLATEGDVQSVHDGGSAEESRLLSLGVLDKIFALIKARFTDLFGSNDVLPIEHGGTGQTTKAAVRNTLGLGNTTGALPVANGGTGATTIADIIKALFGSSAIGSTSKPLYYNGATFAACSASVGAANNGGIVAASLGTNGYVKFANGLILQWGYRATINSYGYSWVTFPIAFASSCFGVINGYEGSGEYWTRNYHSASTTGCQLGYDRQACRYIAWGV
jgi:hypothetical protein